jgi:hypothetical protein
VPVWSFSRSLIAAFLFFAYPSKLWLQIPGNVEKVDEDSSKNNIEKDITQKVWVSLFV